MDPPLRKIKKRKNTQIRKQDQINLRRFCIPKGNPQGKTRTALRIQRNICKGRDPQGIHLQNIQTACAAHYQKYIQTKKKKKKEPKFLQGKLTDGHMKRCLVSLMTREIKIKSPMR